MPAPRKPARESQIRVFRGRFTPAGRPIRRSGPVEPQTGVMSIGFRQSNRQALLERAEQRLANASLR